MKSAVIILMLFVLVAAGERPHFVGIVEKVIGQVELRRDKSAQSILLTATNEGQAVYRLNEVRCGTNSQLLIRQEGKVTVINSTDWMPLLAPSGRSVPRRELIEAWTGILPAGQPRGNAPTNADFAERLPLLPRAPARIALCVGINGYAPGSGYSPLRFAMEDAKAMRDALQNLGYRVILMTDESENSKRPILANLNQTLDALSSEANNPDDTLIISFHCHGDSLDGQSGLIPLDFHIQKQPRLMTFSAVTEALAPRICKAKTKLLILDTCRSSEENLQLRDSTGFINAASRLETLIVFSGCSAGQSSYEDAALAHSRLTASLLEGMKGPAFGNGELLTGDALFAFVADQFTKNGWIQQQNPVRFGRQDAAAKFILAKRTPLDIAPGAKFKGSSVLSKPEEHSSSSFLSSPQEVNAAIEAARTKLRSGDRRGHTGLGHAFLRLGYLDDAINECSQSLAVDPSDALALRTRGIAHFQKGELALAIADLRKVKDEMQRERIKWRYLVRGPEAALMSIALGLGSRVLHLDFVEASAALAQAGAVEGSPADLKALAQFYQGYLEAETGHYTNAIQHFTSVLEAAEIDTPEDLRAAALLNRGVCFHLSDDFSAAVTDYRNVTEKYTRSSKFVALAFVHRGLLYGTNRLDLAIEDFARFIELRLPHIRSIEDRANTERVLEEERSFPITASLTAEAMQKGRALIEQSKTAASASPIEIEKHWKDAQTIASDLITFSGTFSKILSDADDLIKIASNLESDAIALNSRLLGVQERRSELELLRSEAIQFENTLDRSLKTNAIDELQTQTVADFRTTLREFETNGDQVAEAGLEITNRISGVRTNVTQLNAAKNQIAQMHKIATNVSSQAEQVRITARNLNLSVLDAVGFRQQAIRSLSEATQALTSAAVLFYQANVHFIGRTAPQLMPDTLEFVVKVLPRLRINDINREYYDAHSPIEYHKKALTERTNSSSRHGINSVRTISELVEKAQDMTTHLKRAIAEIHEIVEQWLPMNQGYHSLQSRLLNCITTIENQEQQETILKVKFERLAEDQKQARDLTERTIAQLTGATSALETQTKFLIREATHLIEKSETISKFVSPFDWRKHDEMNN